MSPGKERRRHHRHHSNMFIDVETIGTSEQVARGIVTDVSSSGLAMESDNDLSIDKDFNCFVEFPVKMKVKVVRRRRKGQSIVYGLRIVEPGMFDRLILRYLLRGRLRTRKLQR